MVEEQRYAWLIENDDVTGEVVNWYIPLTEANRIELEEFERDLGHINGPHDYLVPIFTLRRDKIPPTETMVNTLVEYDDAHNVYAKGKSS